MLTVIEDDWRAPTPYEQHDALCTIAQMGGLATRSYVLSVGASYRHVISPGVFNEELFVALDQAIAEADETGVRLILPFVDQWDWWGELPLIRASVVVPLPTSGLTARSATITSPPSTTF